MFNQNNKGRSFISGRRLSEEIRENIKNHKDKGLKTNEIANIEQIHYNTAKKYFMETEKVTKPQKWTLLHNPKNIILLETMIEIYPTMINKEKSEIFRRITGHSISTSYLSKIQKNLGYRRKRVCPVAIQRSSRRIIYLRKEFCKTMLNFDYKRIIFIDEVHVSSKDTSVAYGYFKNSELKNNFVLNNFFTNQSFSFIVAMDYTGIKAIYFKDTRNQGVNAEDFINFLDMLEVNEDSILYMDNARTHKTQNVFEKLNQMNCQYVNSSPYSPDFNAIEMSFNIIKNTLHKHTSKSNSIPEAFYSCCNDINPAVFESLVKKVFDRYKNFNEVFKE